jgi:hypothetical protein
MKSIKLLCDRKLRVQYATEFGSSITLIKPRELLEFTKKFKILSLDWL